jgi:hypothetical protein
MGESEHPRSEDGKFGSGGKKSAKLTAREKAEVDRYSGDDFLRINKELREGKTSDPSIRHIDAAIEKSKIPRGSILYRGMTREAAKKIFGSHVNVGADISDPAYVSTSTSRSIAGMRAIGGVMLQIETGADAKGLDMAAISRNPAEKEVLLPRGAKLKITGVTAPKSVGDPVIVRAAYG